MPQQAILSIQSHVAYGHVGNAAAVFPMQRLGHEVWPVHTVLFSNHTGYDTYRGPVIAPEDLRMVLQGVAERGAFARCQAVLSGYMGAAALGEVILDTVADVRAANPAALYCCDPVMGDEGTGLYVRPDIPAFMARRAVPAAHIVTPNQFELRLLTGLPADTLSEATKAADALRALGPRLVLVTSLRRGDAPDDSIEMLLVSDSGAWLVRTPRLPVPDGLSGSGDATTALFLAHYLRLGVPAAALEAAAEAIFAVFEATARAGTCELQLIAAQDAIAASRPGGRFSAEKIA